ncbi:NUDIX hydrolase [Kribbella antibiotica]|uniref:NUDIX hydrolase n=1 Tax=Kribbella antibiotica TaxID=190195 RepID=A0A4R4YU96_9ACTN|nr:NUDIX hydrolase [Kribbella antibiotica]TDD48310.1 NUDIX hydrolase [Kribbella antibiotica]
MTVPDYIARMPRKRQASAVLIRDESNRVLLLEPSYKPNWELPGGIVEADESPWAAAAREVLEELDLVLPIGRLLVADYIHAYEDRPEGINFVFDGGTLADAPTTFPDGEILSAHFLTLAEVQPRVRSMMHNRITTALAAIAEGATALCEQGFRVA